MTFRISITGKNAVIAIATVCVIVVSTVAVVATPEQITGWRWRIVLLGAIAVTATIGQMLWQSNDDEKLKLMMTTLLRAVVKSEASAESLKTMMTTLLRMVVKSQATELPQEKEVTGLDPAKDPILYVEIEDKRRGSMNASTPFKLINRGKAPAHHIQIQPLKLHSGEVTFAPVEVLPDHNKPMAVVPDVQKMSPIFRHDLTRLLQRDWNESVSGFPTESQFEFVQPMSVTYETYDLKSKFETSFDLVYRVVQDIIQKDWHVSVEGEPPMLEVRNLRFKRLLL